MWITGHWSDYHCYPGVFAWQHHLPDIWVSFNMSYKMPAELCSNFFFFFSSFIAFIFIFYFFISWRLITSQYCSGFCHTLTRISHSFTCIPHPDPPSHFPLYPIPLGLPSAPGPSTCLMHPSWAGDLFHPR